MPTDGNWTFTVNDGGTTATLTKFSGSGVTELIVPQTVTSDGYTYVVTSLAGSDTTNTVVTDSNLASSGCTLTLPSSLTSIGGYAFCNCTRFRGDLTLPDSITTVGIYSFGGCGFDGKLTLPRNLQSLSMNSFRNCHFTGHLTIPHGMTQITRIAFYGCSGLTSILLPSTLTTIQGNAFQNCTNLKTVYWNYGGITPQRGSTGNGYVAYYASYLYLCDTLTVNTINGQGTLQPYNFLYWTYYHDEYDQEDPTVPVIQVIGDMINSRWVPDQSIKAVPASGWVFDEWSNYDSGGFPRTVSFEEAATNAKVSVKVNGQWKEGKPFVKVNGAWKEATKVYIKVNGAWKESK